MKKSIRLNLGSGGNKIPGYVNIDAEPGCKPDIVCNFVENPLPYKDGEVEQIVFFHCIEHITKRQHSKVLREFHRVLKPGGRLLISYPEFLRCVDKWQKNERGLKDFWEKTIFGRQLYPADYHVCIMHTPDFKQTLARAGFKAIQARQEETEDQYTILTCVKGSEYKQYEDVCRDQMDSTRVIQRNPPRGTKEKNNGKELFGKRKRN